MNSFNFKRAGLNMKKKKYIKKEANNKTQSNDNSDNNKYNYINPNLTDKEKELLKLYWPNYSTEKKTLAQIIKDKEVYYKVNKHWFDFLYNY